MAIGFSGLPVGDCLPPFSRNYSYNTYPFQNPYPHQQASQAQPIAYADC